MRLENITFFVYPPSHCIRYMKYLQNNSYVDIYDQIPNSVTAVLTICYVAISLVAIVGNSLVMYVVCVSRSISYCKLHQCVFPSSGECKL